jgi:hypothetical protein
VWRFNTAVRDIALYVEDKGDHLSVSGHIHGQKEKHYINTYQEMAIWKSIATLIYRELPALGRTIYIFKLIYRYLLTFGR